MADSSTPSSAAPAAGDRRPTGVVYGQACRRHDTGPGHPDSPWRCPAIMAALAEADFADRLQVLRPRPATQEELLACHSREYIETARRDVASGRADLSTGDTAICRESFEAALLSAGGVVSAVDAVFAGQVRNAFCVVRPPGHHAGPTRGMGFCLFNNVAVAARYAQNAYAVERVLIVDWDVHHGNGTQEIFYDDPSVLYFSTHQWPMYPGTGDPRETGAGAAEGTTINCPLPPGAGRDEVLAAFTDRLLPAAGRFRPQLVLVSAGFDSRLADPLGALRLTDADFAELTALVMRLADEHAAGRLISALEGGYDLAGLARAAAAHCRTLSEK